MIRLYPLADLEQFTFSKPIFNWDFPEKPLPVGIKAFTANKKAKNTINWANISSQFVLTNDEWIRVQLGLLLIVEGEDFGGELKALFLFYPISIKSVFLFFAQNSWNSKFPNSDIPTLKLCAGEGEVMTSDCSKMWSKGWWRSIRSEIRITWLEDNQYSYRKPSYIISSKLLPDSFISLTSSLLYNKDHKVIDLS